MSQPVKECRSETLITEYLCPSLKLQVGGGYHRAGEVAAGAELEESLTPCWSEGDKADLIQDNQLVTLKLLLQPAQALLVLGLAEFIDESSSGVEPDLPALLASQKPQANGKVGLIPVPVLPIAMPLSPKGISEEKVGVLPTVNYGGRYWT